MQLFQGHPPFSEFHRQPIQKFRMIGGGSLGAEIAARTNQTVAKEGTPCPVDDHAVTNGVLVTDYPTGELKTIEGFLTGGQAKDIRDA